MSAVRLDDGQIRRYGRQILLDAIGGKGQRGLLAGEVVVALDEQDRERLAAAEVALLYLAGAGVGRLRLIGDRRAPVRVDEVGMLLALDDVGQPRGEAIAQRLAALNPEVHVGFDAAANGGGSIELHLDGAPIVDELLAGEAQRAARAMWRGAAAATAAIAALLRGSP
jgi:hypothetical protein